MFQNTPLLYIFGPAVLIGSLIIKATRNRLNKQGLNEFDKAIGQLKVNTIVLGVLLMVLWFLLSSIPVLSTFGYPEKLSDIKTDEKMLHYLQQYNRAIVRTTETVYWLIFLFVWWFLTLLYGAVKTIRIKQR